MTTSTSMERFKFNSPTSIGIYAPPYSGKSTLTQQLLEHAQEMFTTPPTAVVYCYKEWLSIFDNLKKSVPNFITHRGLPTREDIEEWATGKHFILVLDDLQQQVEKDRESAELFTVGSHHLNFTLIYLCHNIFGQSYFSRMINRSNHYLILFRNNRDVLQVQTLGRQMFGKGKEVAYFLDAYQKATSEPYGYLVVNSHPKRNKDDYHLLTHILPQDLTVVYVPKDLKNT